MKLVALQQADPLAEFGSESQQGAGVPAAGGPRVPKRWVLLGGAVVVLAAVAASGTLLAKRWLAVPGHAEVTIETTPSGADVLWGNISRGRTPLTLTLPPGEQVVEVTSGTQTVPVRLSLAAGSTSQRHVIFGPSVAVPSAPAAAPATVAKSAAAPPSPPPAPGVTAGWLSVNSAIPVRLLEGGQVVGSSEIARIMLPAGTHDLEFVNETLGFRAQRTVTISAAKLTPLRLEMPRVTLSINAIPWADVTVDADHVGETPIGNYSVPIGSHEIVFRHPEFGERRRQVTVGLKVPARVTEDLRKQ